MHAQMSEQIVNYIQGRANDRLEKFDKDAEKLREKISEESLAELNASLGAKRAEKVLKFKPAIWLSDAATRAKQISFVSHPLKFTHADAKGNSVYAPKVADSNVFNYVTTSALSNPKIDVVGNAAALDVASLLQLEVDGISLASLIAQDDMTAFQAFAKDDEAQLADWRDGFKQALADKEIRSHALAKQLYFPISENSYHLISPLYASSLAQALYQRVDDRRFSDAAIETRKLKKEGAFSEVVTVDFLNVAVQTFGGTKPQNVSLLNSKRRGKSFLLSCQAPTWNQRKLPPSTHADSFWQEYTRLARPTTKELKKFLLSVAERDSTKVIRDKRAELVDDLIDILFQYAAEVQNMSEHAGWSEQSKISIAEQLWLDPLRLDAQFQAERKAKDWQEEIANQFARWLNSKLKDDKLVMKDTEYREWSKQLEEKLARLKVDIAFEDETEEIST